MIEKENIKSKNLLDKDVLIVGTSLDQYGKIGYYHAPVEDKKETIFTDIAESVVNLNKEMTLSKSDGMEIEELTAEEIAEINSLASEIDTSLDENRAEDNISITAKVNRIKKQIEVIEIQESGKLLFVDKSEIPKEYNNVLVVDDFQRFAKDLLDKDKLTQTIKELEDSLEMTHLFEHIRKPAFAISETTLRSTINKTYKKMTLRTKDVRKSTMKIYGMKLDALLPTLNQISENAFFNRQFVYAFCKYIDRCNGLQFVYIESIIDNIVSLEKYDLKQNLKFKKQLNALYQMLFG